MNQPAMAGSGVSPWLVLFGGALEPSGPERAGRHGLVATQAGGLLLFGGTGPEGRSNTVWAYPDSDWRRQHTCSF